MSRVTHFCLRRSYVAMYFSVQYTQDVLKERELCEPKVCLFVCYARRPGWLVLAYTYGTTIRKQPQVCGKKERPSSLSIISEREL